MITKELQKKALQLNPLDRIHLVEMILESLDKPDHEIEKAWVAESEARYTAYKAGKIKAVSLNGVQKRLKIGTSSGRASLLAGTGYRSCPGFFKNPGEISLDL